MKEDLELGGQIRSQYGKCKIAVTVRQQQVVLQSSEEAGPSQALVPVRLSLYLNTGASKTVCWRGLCY